MSRVACGCPVVRQMWAEPDPVRGRHLLIPGGFTLERQFRQRVPGQAGNQHGVRCTSDLFIERLPLLQTGIGVLLKRRIDELSFFVPSVKCASVCVRRFNARR
jgi:hypothetical protein